MGLLGPKLGSSGFGRQRAVRYGAGPHAPKSSQTLQHQRLPMMGSSPHRSQLYCSSFFRMHGSYIVPPCPPIEAQRATRTYRISQSAAGVLAGAKCSRRRRGTANPGRAAGCTGQPVGSLLLAAQAPTLEFVRCGSSATPLV